MRYRDTVHEAGMRVWSYRAAADALYAVVDIFDRGAGWCVTRSNVLVEARNQREYPPSGLSENE